MSPLRVYAGCGVTLVSLIVALMLAAAVAISSCVSPDVFTCRERDWLVRGIILGAVAANVVMWVLLAKVGRK